jgi:hypothetical protein
MAVEEIGPWKSKSYSGNPDILEEIKPNKGITGSPLRIGCNHKNLTKQMQPKRDT